MYSCGGFGSLTSVRQVVDRAVQRIVPTVLLHVGDLDPSGESIFESLINDVQAFLREEVETAATEAAPNAIGPLAEREAAEARLADLRGRLDDFRRATDRLQTIRAAPKCRCLARCGFCTVECPLRARRQSPSWGRAGVSGRKGRPRGRGGVKHEERRHLRKCANRPVRAATSSRSGPGRS
jgi:hypothetical protein